MIRLAFAEPRPPWSTNVRQATGATLDNWTVDHASAVWNWWVATPDLVDLLAADIPNQSAIERDLAAKCPATLPEALGGRVRQFAEARHWHLLHAITLAAYAEPQAAFSAQLALDRDAGHADGLRALATRFPPGELLRAALDATDERLVQLAGEAVATNADLLAGLDVTNPVWRRIWLRAIEHRGDSLAGSPAMVWALLDLVVEGQEVDANLLLRLARASVGDLSDYPRRREVWGILPASIAHDFLIATAQGWLARFRHNPAYDPTVERPLEDAIVGHERTPDWLRPRPEYPASFGVALFERFARLTEGQFETWLGGVAGTGEVVGLVDAARLGRLISSRSWRTAANALVLHVDARNRRDLIPALHECQHLLGLLTRWRLRAAGKLSTTATTPDEWWRTLAETASQLYPRGPEESQIWVRSGGDLAAITTGWSGGANWDAALRRLRAGGGGQDITAERLLREMHRDFAHNESLAALEDVGRML